MIGPNVVFKYIHNDIIFFRIQLSSLVQLLRQVTHVPSLIQATARTVKTIILAKAKAITPMVTLCKFASQL